MFFVMKEDTKDNVSLIIFILLGVILLNTQIGPESLDSQDNLISDQPSLQKPAILQDSVNHQPPEQCCTFVKDGRELACFAVTGSDCSYCDSVC